MRYRSLVFTMAVPIAAGLLVYQKPVIAQTAPKEKPWVPARTPDGQPDLQGYWTNNTITPLERPKALGSKELYTESELQELVKREQNRVQLNEEEGRPTEAGTDADVHYDFSQFGLDPGQTKQVWNRRTSMIVGPEGTIPSMLPEARKRNAALAAKNKGHEFDGPENRPLSARCIVMGQESVPMLSGGYNNNLQIVQTKGYVAIMHEMNHSVRIIPTDGRPHVSPQVKQWRGDSRGHWEGNTLVVDTTNFTATNPFRGSGDKLHVVERFTPMSADAVLYQFTVEDPETWDKPWTAETVWSRVDGPIYEFACNEGNYGLRNTLDGARVAEKEAAAKAAGK
ncbi:MAG: hypothetical protein JO099_12790, partial [Acidobacteriia bacterium]|nr:hypothetical protein [Terriglobia bacterium]